MKKNIFIYGAGHIGEYLLDILTKEGYKVKGFIDKYKVGNINGIPIFSVEESCNFRDCSILISIQDLYICVEVYETMRNIGLDIYWYRDSFSKIMPLSECCLNITEWGECVLPRLDMHVSDTCNLNCVGCTHFSPLFNEVGCELSQCIDNINLVLNKFSGIARLNLLGGEPLLNIHLGELIEAIREKLPSTTIVLFTNGLLIYKLPETLLNIFHDNEIQLYISEYKPTHKIIDEIIKKLDLYKISYVLSGFDNKKLFNKPLAINIDDESEKKCISNGCISIADGKIARCPTLLYIYKLNETFGCDFPTQGIYDLRNCKTDGKCLMKKLGKKVELCEFCIKNEIEWNVCGKERMISDFVRM